MKTFFKTTVYSLLLLKAFGWPLPEMMAGNSRQPKFAQLLSIKSNTDTGKSERPLKAREQIKCMMKEVYSTGEGERYKIVRKPGLSEKKVEELAKKLPTGKIPAEIRELLRFTKGLSCYGLEDITFDNISGSGRELYKPFFPNAIQLTGDGFGNFWIVAIDNNGNWGGVFLVCSDPQVIIKQAHSLSHFLQQIHDLGKSEENSALLVTLEQTCNEVWKKENGLIDLDEAKNSTDTVLKNFALSLPDNYIIADMRNKPVQSGFAWGKCKSAMENAIRHESELIWAFEKKEKKGLLSNVFGK